MKRNSIKAEQPREQKIESPDNRQFNLPNLATFPEFRQGLERFREKYLQFTFF